MAAVLTGIAVALENVVPREFDFLLGQPVEHDQQNDARDADFEGDGGDGFRVRLLGGEIAPLAEAEGLEIAVASFNTTWACPSKSSVRARRAVQTLTACHNRFSTSTCWLRKELITTLFWRKVA
jgi:hypothetical protein